MTNTQMKEKYVHYGCGLDAPDGWLNYDASPTLILHKNYILNVLFKRWINVKFPKNVMLGDITKGTLGLRGGSVKAVYCSHVLEHLSLMDLRNALVNTYKLLMEKGMFRLVVPDLEYYIKEYNLSNSNESAIEFMKGTLLGKVERKRNFRAIIESAFGNSNHLWMWDYKSMVNELENAGFREVRKCLPGDSIDPMFKKVENPSRFKNALALECKK